MTVLSSRIEILVFPGSILMTAPRLALEKSMSRTGSAASFFILGSLWFVCLPGRDDPVGVRLPMGVDEDEQGACGAHPQRDEPLLVRIWLGTTTLRSSWRGSYSRSSSSCSQRVARSARLRRSTWKPAST